MEKKIKYIHVIINPAAGKDEAILPVINSAMKEAGIKWEGLITHKAGDGIEFAKAAVKEKVDAIAVYGGDGTVMEAISGMMGSDIPLVILPGGSANVMATELGIPMDLKEACALLAQGHLKKKPLDIGQFGKRYFITGISIGFEADMVQGANRRRFYSFYSLFLGGYASFVGIYGLRSPQPQVGTRDFARDGRDRAVRRTEKSGGDSCPARSINGPDSDKRRNRPVG